MKPKTKPFLSLLWRDCIESVKFAALALVALFIIGVIGWAAFKTVLWLSADSEDAIVASPCGVLLSLAVIMWIMARWHQSHAFTDKTT